jgi:hypothetical protein
MIREMRTLQQVAISRVAIERRTGRDQGGDGRTISGNRPAQLKPVSIVAGARSAPLRRRGRADFSIRNYSSPEVYF